MTMMMNNNAQIFFFSQRGEQFEKQHPVEGTKSPPPTPHQRRSVQAGLAEGLHGLRGDGTHDAIAQRQGYVLRDFPHGVGEGQTSGGGCAGARRSSFDFRLDGCQRYFGFPALLVPAAQAEEGDGGDDPDAVAAASLVVASSQSKVTSGRRSHSSPQRRGERGGRHRYGCTRLRRHIGCFLLSWRQKRNEKKREREQGRFRTKEPSLLLLLLLKYSPWVVSCRREVSVRIFPDDDDDALLSA